jgi:hypothetical protein
MPFNIKVVNPLDMKDWDDRILSFKNYSFFHSQSWTNVLINTYHYRPRFFTLWQQDKMRAVIPMFEVTSSIFGKKGASLPFSDHCKPLVTESDDFERLFFEIKKKGEKWKWQRIDFRGGQEFMSDAPQAVGYNLHILNLKSDIKALLKSFRSSTKRNIKKAQQKNITIDIATDLAAVREFYRLNCITRKHHGVPPQPFNFFRCIQEYILSKGQGIVVLARHDGQALAGAIYFHFGRKSMYKYGASRRDNLGIRPNNLVMWEAIKWYCENGFSHFDMGRSEPDNAGLNQFKNGWGTIVEQLSYYTFDIPQMKFSWKDKKNGTSVNRIFRKMPVPILRIVGELAYRHIG